MKQTIRIIGGQFRGKKLQFPSIDGLRPTPDRVRETLFNWLMHAIRNANCLDAFAGSGALGFEAFSRGAGQVTLIEKSISAYTNLKKICSDFNSPNIQVKHADTRDYLLQTSNQFDIIFLDPPFASTYLDECVAILTKKNTLSPNGLLYIESGQEVALDPTTWEQIKFKRAGQVFYGLFKKIC